MRQLTRVVAVLSVLILAGTSAANAQTGEGFNEGYVDVGPVIGIGGIGSAGLSFGGRLEIGLKQLPTLGDGVLSFEGSVDHYSFDEFCTGCGFSYTPIGATLNYHFHLDNRKVDPFVGLGLGDYIVTSPAICPSCSFNSGIYFIARAGIRYFLTPSFSLYGDVGSGAGALHIGVMFKIKDGK